MLQYAIKDQATDEYLCDGQWGEEPEWFNASEIDAELKQAQVSRPQARSFSEDFSVTEWM